MVRRATSSKDSEYLSSNPHLPITTDTTLRAYGNENQQFGQEAQPADGDRGIGGAITGGLAGGFGGHQVGHGLLGTIGGAILGSFAEDKLKKHENNKNEQQQRPSSGQGQQGSHGHSFGFSESLSESVNFGGKKH